MYKDYRSFANTCCEKIWVQLPIEDNGATRVQQALSQGSDVDKLHRKSQTVLTTTTLC